MDQPLLLKALKAHQANQPYCLVTIIESTLKGTPQKSGAKMLVFPDGSIAGTIGGGRNEKAATKEALKAIKTGEPKVVTYDFFGHAGQSVCGGQMKAFFEPAQPLKRLIICGAGHIGLPLSILGKMLNFHVTIIDNRRKYANKKRFPHADAVKVGPHAKVLDKIKIDQNTYIMIVTHGNEHDFECLKKTIKSSAAFIGVISSKAKKIKFFKRLRSAKINEKYLRKISIPAGIDLGAQTPEEIGISIMAEIVKNINKKRVGTTKFKS